MEDAENKAAAKRRSMKVIRKLIFLHRRDNGRQRVDNNMMFN